MKVLRALVMSIGVCATVVPTIVTANELNDSIQAFHRGDYANAVPGLEQLIREGTQDPRVFYYRGLIRLRQRNHQAAAQDFQAAMHLEAGGHGAGVSAALERVQGHERLVVEKYRALARLAARDRQQASAPPPQVLNSDDNVTLATVETPAGQPLFRLASEIPIRQTPTPVSPSADESLVAGDAPEQPAPVPSTADEPVGTGLADSADDPFAEFGDASVDEAIQDAAAPAGKARSAIGGVLRALFRANVPQIPLQGVIPPGMPGAPAPGGPAGGPGFGDAGGADPGFGDDAFGFGDDNSGFGEETTEEDPFDGF